MRDSAASVKHWRILPPASPEALRRLSAFHPVMAQVLVNRGQDTPEKAQAFLVGSPDELHNPFAMHGMQQAVGRIRRAIKAGEAIAVYGDFDADGVTSTALLTQALEALGGRVMPYIPNRVDEGYGLNEDALRSLRDQGVKLVITVDCGIRSVDEVAAGNALGLDMIVTDHHSVGEQLPPALAVIDPKIDLKRRQEEGVTNGYPEDMLAGVGVAYKLADALFRAEQEMSRRKPNFKLEDLLDLVALGTVADLAPLDRPENRELVRRGLEVLNQAQRPGIFDLAQIAGAEPGKITTTSIGFMLAPRINAAGRLADAMIAFRLLTRPMPETLALAQELQRLNEDRQSLTMQAVEVARDEVFRERAAAPLIFYQISHETDHHVSMSGIVGLVAGRLCEEFYIPAVVIEQNEEESRGSCRSIPEFNITDALDQCADLLVRHGGHAQAAGFTVRNENIGLLRERLIAMATQQLAGQDLRPTIEVDMEVPFDYLTMELAKDLRALEPTGARNEAPVFVTRRLQVVDCRRVGFEGKHLRLKFSNGTTMIDGIGFKLGERAENLPSVVDVVYHLEINEWNGFVKLQMNVQDVRGAGLVDD